MIWGKSYQEKKIIKNRKNDNWYAWHPVQLVTGRWVWLQRIKRVSHRVVGGGWSGPAWWVYEEKI